MQNRLVIILLLISSVSFAQLHTYKWTNENKKAEGVVKNGLEQGKWMFWSKNGVIQQEVTYKDGMFDGKYTNYNEQGKKREEGFFIKSKKEENPEKSYTAMLQQSDVNETLKKIEEEAFEVIDAVKLKNKSNIVHEVADLWFHCLVVLAKKNLTVEDITNELKRRQGISGIEEKLNRTKKVK